MWTCITSAHVDGLKPRRPESIPAPVTLSPDLPRSPYLTQLNSIEIPDGRQLECVQLESWQSERGVMLCMSPIRAEHHKTGRVCPPVLVPGGMMRLNTKAVLSVLGRGDVSLSQGDD